MPKQSSATEKIVHTHYHLKKCTKIITATNVMGGFIEGSFLDLFA